ncbi:helix-turn-helix transcriptional regulator [Paraburkholderia madseniana]|uniref:helix-turn-helix domain-containing protein n=1 Tax=Paraburkholderia madseniana TaxID=2599607 RepID=UPI0038BD1515
MIESSSANARIETIAALSAALGIDPSRFFGIRQQPTRTDERIKCFRLSVAANIRTQRTKRALLQNKLTKLAGLPKGYMSQIQRKALDLTLDVLDQIATALKIGIVQLLRPALP